MCACQLNSFVRGSGRKAGHALLMFCAYLLLGAPGLSMAQETSSPIAVGSGMAKAPAACTNPRNQPIRFFMEYTNGVVDSGTWYGQGNEIEDGDSNDPCLEYANGDTVIDAATIHLSCSVDYDLEPTAVGNGLTVETWSFYRPGFGGGVCGDPFPGELIVEKVTVPGGAGQSFDFAIGALESFILSDGESQSFFLEAGSYIVSETVPDGWALDGITCVDPSGGTTTDVSSAMATVGLAQDEVVTCTFTNEKQAVVEEATITIEKVTDPSGSSQFFNYSGDLGNFSLMHGESESFTVSPGTYGVSEMVPGGWELTSATCDNSDTPNAITVADGDSVTCTFVNTQLAADLEIVKRTNGETGDGATCNLIPVGDAVTWTYEVSNPGEQSLDILSILDDNGTPGSSGDDFTPGGPSGDDGNGLLDPGETWTYTQAGATAVAGEYINTVTVQGEVVAEVEAKAEPGTILTRSDTSRYCGTIVDLAIAKTDGDLEFVAEGGTLIYTLTFENLGTEDLTGVVITDSVPTNTTFSAGASSAGWSCADGDPAGTVCSFNVGALASGASGQVFLGLDVDELWEPDPETGDCPPDPSPLTIDNTATITDDGANGADVNPDNNTSSDDTPVIVQCEDLPQGTLDINIEKTPDGQQVNAGETATFTIEVTNSGEANLINVTVTDPQSPDCDNFIGDLAVGASVSYSCERESVVAGFTNVATVTGEGEEDGEVTDDDDAIVFLLDEPAQMHHQVPTLSQWAVILTIALMLGIGALRSRKWTRR